MVKRLIALVAVVLLLAGCGVQEAPETTDNRKLVGICLPDGNWKPEGTRLSDALIAAGYAVSLEYANADPLIQQMQLESLLGRGADLLILCAIDSIALSGALQQAKEAGVPVLAYDRMLQYTDGVTACVAPDTFTAGKELGQYILEHLPENLPATIEFLMGTPEDPSAWLFHKGLMEQLSPVLENGQLLARSGRASFEDTCVQNASPFTARSYLLDYSLDFYDNAMPDFVCVGAVGMAEQCATTFPEDGSPIPLLVGIGDKDSNEPFTAYAAFDREQLASTCVTWAQQLLEDPASLPKDTVQNNGAIDVPTFLLSPKIIK